MTDYSEVIITAPDADWLADFTRALVDDRLAACGHISTPIRSIYRWQGQVHDGTEARVALHTRADLVPAIIERTTRDHPYDVPCVIATLITDGNPAYLAWVGEETMTPTGAAKPIEPLTDSSAETPSEEAGSRVGARLSAATGAPCGVTVAARDKGGRAFPA